MAMDRREELRSKEIDGIAEAYLDAARNEVRFRPEFRDGGVMVQDHFPIHSYNPIFAVIYLLAYLLKAAMLIYYKLDEIHTHVWQMEERDAIRFKDR